MLVLMITAARINMILRTTQTLGRKDDELDYGESIEFLEHMQECPNCREELAIQFLVTEGMANYKEPDDRSNKRYDDQSAADGKTS